MKAWEGSGLLGLLFMNGGMASKIQRRTLKIGRVAGGKAQCYLQLPAAPGQLCGLDLSPSSLGSTAKNADVNNHF